MTVTTSTRTAPPSSSPVKPASQGSKNLLQNVLFGGVSGVIGTSTIFPFYTIKTRLHLYPGQYNSILHCARSIFTQSGIRGLYKGLPPALTGVFPEKAIKLSVNDYLTAILSNPQTGHISIPRSMLAGAGAGLCQVVATNPMEMLMINIQSAAAKGKSTDMFALIRQLGLKGLYKGSAATLFRDIPFSIVFFSMNSSIRQALTDDQGRLPMSKVFFSGILSGSAAAAISTPADVIKTRLQASAGDAAKSASSKTSTPLDMRGLTDAVRPASGVGGGKVTSTTSATQTRSFCTGATGMGSVGAGAEKMRYTGIAHCARHIYATNGIRGFFAGVGPRIMIISPLFGITLWVYDVQRRLQESGKL